MCLPPEMLTSPTAWKPQNVVRLLMVKCWFVVVLNVKVLEGRTIFGRSCYVYIYVYNNISGQMESYFSKLDLF